MYRLTQIANELDATALGESYYGNGLYVSLGLPFLTYEDRIIISSWLDGRNLEHKNNLSTELQSIAIKIRNEAKHENNS